MLLQRPPEDPQPPAWRCCWICTANDALKAAQTALASLDNAVEAAVERGTDWEGNLYYLRDEVEVLLKRRFPFPGRKRLRHALRAVSR